MRYLFFLNPTAGKGKFQETIRADIEEYFRKNDGEYKIYITEYAGHAEKIAREEAMTGDRIRMFACGGEGTCYEVLNGVFGFDNVELGVIPCGSANDLLKFFGDSEPFTHIAAQISGGAISMDVIKAGDRYCLNGCSVGMDAMVARDMHIFKRLPLVSGALAYKLAIVKNFLGRLGVSIDITVDGEPLGRKDCLFAVVANGPYYGGGYKGAPDATPYDAKLDFTLVDTVSHLKVLKFISLYERGEHKELYCCHLKNCKSMEFRSDKPIPVNLDGEIIEADNMRFELVEKGVSFVVPTGIKEKLLINV